MANNKPPAIPGRAAGIITFFIASERVDPTASAPSLSEVGTAVMASSEIEETKGIVIIPITSPAARALSEETSKPTASPPRLSHGATTIAAKKP